MGIKIKDFTTGAGVAGITVTWTSLTSLSITSCSGVCGNCGFGCISPLVVLAVLGIKKLPINKGNLLNSVHRDKNTDNSQGK